MLGTTRKLPYVIPFVLICWHGTAARGVLYVPTTVHDVDLLANGKM